MRLRRTVVSLVLGALPVAAQQSESFQPILDVQLRVSAPGVCPAKPDEAISALDSKNKTAGSQNPTCPNHLSAADTDEELRQQTVAILKEYNMIAVAMLPPAQAKQW
jgi:predicted phosphoribosyltransferase